MQVLGFGFWVFGGAFPPFLATPALLDNAKQELFNLIL